MRTGHCAAPRLDAFRGFTAFSKIHGLEQAMKIQKHEKLVLEKVVDFITSNKVDCDFDLCGTFGTPHHLSRLAFADKLSTDH